MSWLVFGGGMSVGVVIGALLILAIIMWGGE